MHAVGIKPTQPAPLVPQHNDQRKLPRGPIDDVMFAQLKYAMKPLGDNVIGVI